MNKLTPKVSVLMSVYNGSRYLRESIESILNQSFTDFEFIIIEDCSTDNTWEILTEYANRDQRIRLFKNEENIGLTKSLNEGLRSAQGQYIARQDADDVSLSEKLEKQVFYMESHPSVALVATDAQYIDENGNELWTHITPKDLALHWHLIFRNPIRHSTVLWRRELIADRVGNYDPSFICSQDYDLWARIAENWIIDTLPLTLVILRWHSQSITLTKLKIQNALAARVTHRELTHYLPTRKFTEQDVNDLRVMPQVENELQHQHFNSLSASRFQQAACHYLQLWQQFRLAHNLESNPLSLHDLQREVERSLIELLRHCKQRQWFEIAYKLVLFYLSDRPSRTLALTLALPRVLVPSTWRLWYRSLRSIYLKNA